MFHCDVGVCLSSCGLYFASVNLLFVFSFVFCELLLLLSMSGVRKRLRSSVVASTSSSEVSLYVDNGDCRCVCRYCGAIFWYAERIVSQSTRTYYVSRQESVSFTFFTVAKNFQF